MQYTQISCFTEQITAAQYEANQDYNVSYNECERNKKMQGDKLSVAQVER